MATPPPNEAAKLAILRQQMLDKIKQDEQYKQMTDRQYTGAIQPNPNWMPKKADGGLAHMDKGGRLPQQTDLDMAREAAERIGQHHDPHTRSLQQGYEHDWYHGSTGDIKSFNPNTRGESTGAASAKKGYFFARDPSTPPPEMLEHDPESLALLQRIGATIPPKPTMAGHGAHTASSYAGTGGSREYKEAMRMAKAAEKVGNWSEYEKYMQMAEDAEINSMRYRQDLVAKHGDARDTMYENIKNAWYGAHNAKLFKSMSQPEYEEHDKRYKELMPYGWHIDYKEPHYKALKAQLKKFGNNKQVQSALDAINHYQSVHNERKASEVESGANVMPVALRYKNPMYHDFKGSSYRDQTYSDLMDEALRKGHDALILKNTFDPGGTGKPKMVDVGVVFHPNQVRSKFAAFDPTRTHESNLLAAQGGTVNAFDYENPEHVSAVAGHAAKHKDFKSYDPKLLSEVLSTGDYRHLEDPRIQGAMRKAGHNAYHTQEKTGKKLNKMQSIVKKAVGGGVQPSIAQMKMALTQNKFPSQAALINIGAEEAPNMPVKAYVPPSGGQDGQLPVGGIDMSDITPGMQYMSEEQQAMQPPGQPAPQGPNPLSAGPSAPGQQSNILQMTPQGQAMAAMRPQQGAVKPQMAIGGPVSSLPTMLKQGGTDGNPMDNGATTFSIDDTNLYANGGGVQGYSSKGKVSKRQQTVKNAQRMAYPGIYGRPDEIAALAASRVAPEDPILKQLFGVTRADMYQQAHGRQGMAHLGMLPGAAANPKGSMATEGVMNPRNEQRILDVMTEARKHQGLSHGMEPWYYMDPLFERMVQLLGIEKATQEYKKMNALMGMASSSSEVNTEIPRGSLAYWLQNQGRFDEFVKHGGKRSEDRPSDFGATPGHLAHKTAHALPMQKFLERGEVDMNSPKVPMYIEASGVPATGFQTRTPVGDAHWSRAVGLADTRNPKTIKGQEVVPGASVSTPEMSALGPWWRHKIANKLGLESVPAQALAWGAFSPQTGVTTPIGAPKLELLAKQIGHTAKRLGVAPETARDLVLTGKERMGYKKGGKVASGKLSDNLDTMRLALTKKKAK